MLVVPSLHVLCPEGFRHRSGPNNRDFTVIYSLCIQFSDVLLEDEGEGRIGNQREVLDRESDVRRSTVDVSCGG